MILVGDVGGTKTILALYKLQQSIWVCHKKQQFASADFKQFNDLLAHFLTDENHHSLQSVCIGVAGPIINGDCITTNLPWNLKVNEISLQTNTQTIKLLNDLEATAWGVLNIPDSDFSELNPNAKSNQGNLAILAAGTGLGEALAIWSDEKYHIVATEGGHTDFAPRNELEIGLLRYLINIYPDHVSYERVVCGQGLITIYDYLKSIQYAEVNPTIEAEMLEKDAAAVISISTDTLCQKALDLFCQIYGAEAGNLALKCLPKAGIVLAGGIAAKILPSISNGQFLQAYLAKGRYQGLLNEFSIRVCLNPEAGLLGAVHYSQQYLSK